MGRVEFTRTCPPVHAPRWSLHSSKEEQARGDLVRSIFALPCRRCCSSDDVDCYGGGAEGAYANGSHGSPIASTDTARMAKWNMAGTPVGTGAGVRLRPGGGGGGGAAAARRGHSVRRRKLPPPRPPKTNPLQKCHQKMVLKMWYEGSGDSL